MAASNQPSTVFRVRAHNTAADSENKIHDDQVASSLGFRGGLVPGVTVYGYMIPPVLEVFGLRWLESGGMNVRFFSPCYEGETVASSCDGSVVNAQHQDGSVYASGAVTIDDNTDLTAASFPLHPLPEMDQRPVVSSATILPGLPLGTIRMTLDVAEMTAIPERLLRMANDILVRNFRMSPWIHAGSHLRHHRLAELGQEITVSGVIQECFERKGRSFAIAGIQMSAADGPSLTPIATVRHTSIYQL
jgi:hypothetical protein